MSASYEFSTLSGDDRRRHHGWCHSGDNLMIHKAVSLAVPGISWSSTHRATSFSAGFGELLATSAVKLGIAAVIVDSPVRDGEGLETLRLPVYARGLCPNGCNRDGPGGS